MAQLRQEYDQLIENDIEVLIIGPENAKAFSSYFAEHQLPFPGLPDPKHAVLKLYGQEVKLFKFGRMPAQVLVDKEGIVRFVHYGQQMSDIPQPEEIVADLSAILD